MTRYFIRVTLGGFVDQDMEFDGPEAGNVPGPSDMLEMTSDPRWTGGSLLRYTLANGVFTPPPALAAADPVVEQLNRIEAALATVSAKVDAAAPVEPL